MIARARVKRTVRRSDLLPGTMLVWLLSERDPWWWKGRKEQSTRLVIENDHDLAGEIATIRWLDVEEGRITEIRISNGSLAVDHVLSVRE